MRQKLSFLKSLLTLCLAVVLCQSAFAQKESNYIYILDCSNSMLVNRVDGRPLWDVTLDFLNKQIKNQHENSYVTIIPFQGTVYEPVITSTKAEFNWQKVYNQVKNYPNTPIGTNICVAWDRALEYQNPNMDNYIVLLTDGQDNYEGVNAVCNRIKTWCEKVKNTRGFYVMLHKEAMDQRIIDIVDECEFMEVINPEEGIKEFLSLNKTEFVYNTREPKLLDVPVSSISTHKAHLLNNDALFDVELVNNEFAGGKGVIKVTPKTSTDLSLLDEVLVINDSVIGDGVRVANAKISITVNNVPEHFLSLSTDELNAGKSAWYDSFLWKKAKAHDTLTVDLGAEFNEAARRSGSSIKLAVKSVDKDGNVKPLEKTVSVIWNGEMVDDGVVTLDPAHECNLGLVFADDAAEGKHYFQIAAVPNGANRLDRINDDNPELYTNTMRASYNVVMNPLKVILIWVGIILLAALLLWFLLLKRMFFPTIRAGHIQIEGSPVYLNPVIRGCRKVVFTNRLRSQGFFDKLFFGEIKYVRSDIFDSEWYIAPGSNKDKVRAYSVGGYAMNPPGNTLYVMQPVNMKSVATGKAIKVTLN